MPLVNRAIPTLIGGVSQQPSSLRHPSQVTVMENCIPSPASGLRKRQGTEAIKRISVSPMYGSFVQWVNRGTAGTSERYCITINNGVIRVFNWFGEEQTVLTPDGLGYISTFTPGHIARDIYSAVTVADFTFIANKDVVVAATAAPTFTPVQTMYIVVKVGIADYTYSCKLNGTPYTYTLTPNPNTTVKTDAVAAALAGVITASGTFTAVADGSLITVTKNVPAPFTWDVTDSYGNTALFAFQDRVARFEELPRRFHENIVVAVKGDPNGATPEWFVEWKRDGGTNSDGVWKETVRPGISLGLDATTMPHTLIRNADATWTFAKAAWVNRTVGDELSNPSPSFLGKTISDVFFHRNRLGFLSDENCVMSQAGKYFNFFASTARAVIDSDPVDVSASTTKVTLLRYAIGFDKTLLITSDRQQFILPAVDALTPRTGRLEGTTAFECDTGCRPVAVGKNALFVEGRGKHSGIREYFVNNNTLTNDADDITAHCSYYLPSGVFRLAACPARDMAFALSTQDPGAIYVHNSFWKGEERVQSAWHRWIITGGTEVVSCEAYATTLAMIVDRPDGAWFEAVELEEKPFTDLGWQLSLDRHFYSNAGVYDAASDTTTWALPYPADGPVQIIVIDKPKEIGQVLDSTNSYGSAAIVRGNYAGVGTYIGRRYDMRVVLSQLYYRDPQNLSIIDGRLQLRNVVVALEDTGYLRVTVSPQGRAANTYVFPSKPLGLSALKVGARVMTTGPFTFPVMAKADEVTIELSNDTALPTAIQSLEWDGVFSMKASRR